MPKKPSALKAHPASFARNGFLVLPGFYASTEIDTVQQKITAKIAAREPHIVADDLETGERTVLSLLNFAATDKRVKINDLYLDMEQVRALALNARLAPILETLLGEPPVLCNSLYFEKGSAQPKHVDSLYMTPSTQGHLIAIWVALENVHADAGPLEYYAGSHLIAQKKFSNGSYNSVAAEMPEWDAYMEKNIREKELEKTAFAAKKGDVFIWHAHLLHGGSQIKNSQRTRKSLVFHYFSKSDCAATGNKLVPLAGAYWMARLHQNVPGEVAEKLPFDEETYLARYADVAAAVAQGQFSSGRAHYDLFGRNEGRLGNKA